MSLPYEFNFLVIASKLGELSSISFLFHLKNRNPKLFSRVKNFLREKDFINKNEISHQLLFKMFA